LPEDATNLNVKLKPALTLTGHVKNAADSPLTGAQVGLWLKAGRGYEQLNEQMNPVNAEGRYEIKCLPPDAQHMVYATAKGYGKSQQQVEPALETNRMELAPFVLKLADRVIAGQLLHDNDKPASGADVQLSGDGQPDGYMATDSKGRFHFQVCEGQIHLLAFSQSGAGSAQTTVEAGDTNIVMSLHIVMSLGSSPGSIPTAAPCYAQGQSPARFERDESRRRRRARRPASVVVSFRREPAPVPPCRSSAG
jgi:hypothetical protein